MVATCRNRYDTNTQGNKIQPKPPPIDSQTASHNSQHTGLDASESQPRRTTPSDWEPLQPNTEPNSDHEESIPNASGDADNSPPRHHGGRSRGVPDWLPWQDQLLAQVVQ
ncbi:hypothetical protein BD410DRAFT_845688 [Rickenella mellea]|uniref:Uncharacterized protein n=1 Tax=Rickenella mellea TaxID=50990 RepID=A0A4Y7PH92_9AGAM|nr:hypothetical protein BD410DRAFT_845688 [Rickenella mellea]